VTQLSLLDTPPCELPGSSFPSTVFDEPNRRCGHLLIEAKGLGDYVFLNIGGGVVQFGLLGSDTYAALTSDQLRVVGDYCHRMADRIERRTDV
jgi:hypothetical protein